MSMTSLSLLEHALCNECIRKVYTKIKHLHHGREIIFNKYTEKRTFATFYSAPGCLYLLNCIYSTGGELACDCINDNINHDTCYHIRGIDYVPELYPRIHDSSFIFHNNNNINNSIRAETVLTAVTHINKVSKNRYILVSERSVWKNWRAQIIYISQIRIDSHTIPDTRYTENSFLYNMSQGQDHSMHSYNAQILSSKNNHLISTQSPNQRIRRNCPLAILLPAITRRTNHPHNPPIQSNSSREVKVEGTLASASHPFPSPQSH